MDPPAKSELFEAEVAVGGLLSEVALRWRQCRDRAFGFPDHDLCDLCALPGPGSREAGGGRDAPRARSRRVRASRRLRAS